MKQHAVREGAHGHSRSPATTSRHRPLYVATGHDALEAEANRSARRAVDDPTPSHLPVSSLAEVAGHSPGDIDAPESVHQAIAGRGEPLSEPMRRHFESRFGISLSQVRIHQDPVAGRSARDIHAAAYTVGNHIVFGANRFQPQRPEGLALLSHELTHVVQQARAPGPATRIQRHKDDLVAYTGGQSGSLQVVKAGRLTAMVSAVSGHPGSGENEPGAGPIPSGTYVIHPKVTRTTVATLQGGTCGALGIASGYQQITSTDPSPCSGAHYCNVPCPTSTEPSRKCFTPKDCWGSQRIKIEGSKAVTTPEGKKKTRSGFYIHAGNPTDAVSSGCVKALDESIFAPIRDLSGVKGAVPFCVGKVCEPALKAATAAMIQDGLEGALEAVKELLP